MFFPFLDAFSSNMNSKYQHETNLGMVELQIRPEEVVRPTVTFERLRGPPYK